MAAAASTTEAAAAAAAAAVPNASVANKTAATLAVSVQAADTAVLCTLCVRIRVRIILICVPAYACTHVSGCCCISSGLILLFFFLFFPPQIAAACEAAATAAACAAATPNAGSWEATSVRLVDARCSVYLLYWYKSTNTDAKGGALLGSFLRLRTRASSRCGRSPCPTPHGVRSKSALAYIAWIRYIILVKLRSSTSAVARCPKPRVIRIHSW